MKTFIQGLKKWGIIMGVAIATPVFSESAPVYDVDSLPQQFYNSTDQSEQETSSSEQEDTFVPLHNEANQRNNVAPAAEAHVMSPALLSNEQRIKRLEQQVNNLQSNEGNARIEALQKQVQSLQGQVEQLTHQLQQIQEQQKALYANIDKRLDKSKETSVNVSTEADDLTSVSSMNSKTKNTVKMDKKSTSGAKSLNEETVSNEDNNGSDQPNVAEEQQIYQTAYNLIKAKKYNDAVNALQKMLQKYPSGQFASNAHYWLGELYGLLGKNELALSEFSTVVKLYPESPRVSDAQLKVGLIYATESKWSEAKTVFKKVINRYPGTASARLAAEQLKQIKQAGH